MGPRDRSLETPELLNPIGRGKEMKNPFCFDDCHRVLNLSLFSGHKGRCRASYADVRFHMVVAASDCLLMTLKKIITKKKTPINLVLMKLSYRATLVDLVRVKYFLKRM